MIFRTTINKNEIQKLEKQIDYGSKIGLIGSCFVENIGEKLAYYKFDHFINPYGILFNPKAIEKAISDIVSLRKYTTDDLIYYNNIWHSPHHHSDFSNRDASKTVEDINKSITNSNRALKQATHLIVTLGTAWVYHHNETNQFVANCHKIPQKEFTKQLLKVNEISESLQNSITHIKRINPEIQIIFTLSPVRHLRDGMLANSQSKANLLAAIHEIADKNNCFYFPSYEIQMDDLRDYRFYTKDLLHPTETAVDYIWDVFKEVWIAPRVYSLMNEVASIQKDILHKPFDPTSVENTRFLSKLKEKKEKINQKIGVSF